MSVGLIKGTFFPDHLFEDANQNKDKHYFKHM